MCPTSSGFSTLSLTTLFRSRHDVRMDAGPLGGCRRGCDAVVEPGDHEHQADVAQWVGIAAGQDRKSTRLNSSHSQISYAVFCLKKKTAIQAIRWARPVTKS